MGCGPSVHQMKRIARREVEAERNEQESRRRDLLQYHWNKLSMGSDEFRNELNRNGHSMPRPIFWYYHELLWTARDFFRKVFNDWDGAIMYQEKQWHSPTELKRWSGLLIFEAGMFSPWFPLADRYHIHDVNRQADSEYERGLFPLLLKYKQPVVIEYEYDNNEVGIPRQISVWDGNEIIKLKRKAIREQEQLFRMINRGRKAKLPRCVVDYIGTFVTGLGGKNPLPY